MRPIGKDGTLRDLLIDQERLTGYRDKRLDEADIPSWAEPLWEMLLMLHACRHVGMHGASAISLQDIDAWCRLHDVTLTPWEVDTLLCADAAILRVINARTVDKS